MASLPSYGTPDFRAQLTEAISACLRVRPDQDAREIAAALAAQGWTGVTRSDVNSCLYAERTRYQHDGATRPRWRVIDRTAPPQPSAPRLAVAPTQPETRVDPLELYAWQRCALDGWAAHGHRGVVEAVTGAGKTRLALAAIEREIARGGQAVALVPTRDLQHQWLEEIEEHLVRPGRIRARVGLMGDGAADTLATHDVVVATVQSACRWQLQPRSDRALLIADEAHHYGAETWAAALEPGFDRRLALTATYDRDDGGVEAVLDPYFGSYRYQLGYAQALREDVIAHFRIAFVGVRFTDAELAAYLEQDDRARRKRSLLVNAYGLPAEPFGLFMRAVQRLSRSGDDGARQAGLYLGAFSRRRQLLAAAEAKYDYLAELVPAVEAAAATILFSQTTDAAERAETILWEMGIEGGVLHAELDPSERQDSFDAFRDGSYRFIAAPKLLDEGVDVPDADLAIVLASSRSRRQMIQRMGRIVRKKADGRPGRLAVLYVEGTSEDPTDGAHEDFVDFVTGAADKVAVFDPDANPSRVVDFLNTW